MIPFQRRGLRVQFNGHSWTWVDEYGWVNEEEDVALINEHIEIDCLVFPRQESRIRSKGETEMKRFDQVSAENLDILSKICLTPCFDAETL